MTSLKKQEARWGTAKGLLQPVAQCPTKPQERDLLFIIA